MTQECITMPPNKIFPLLLDGIWIHNRAKLRDALYPRFRGSLLMSRLRGTVDSHTRQAAALTDPIHAKLTYGCLKSKHYGRLDRRQENIVLTPDGASLLAFGADTTSVPDSSASNRHLSGSLELDDVLGDIAVAPGRSMSLRGAH